MVDSRTFRPHGSDGPEKEALRHSCEHVFLAQWREIGLFGQFSHFSDIVLAQFSIAVPECANPANATVALLVLQG